MFAIIRLLETFIAPRNPVCIPGVFANWGMPPGYTCLNSIALSVNGIAAATRSSIDGITIEKDESGEPTGVIIETNQRPRVEYELLKAVPRFTEIERRLLGLPIATSDVRPNVNRVTQALWAGRYFRQ
jgi:hypothetical protein